MIKYLCLLALVTAGPARACETLFTGRLVLAAAIPRLDFGDLALDRTALIAGDDALTSLRPARVLGRRGVDEALVIDVREASRDFDAFARHTLGVPDTATGRTWRDQLRTRLETYRGFARTPPGWRSWWTDGQFVRQLDDIFFVRFFGPQPDEAPFAVVSLRAPAITPFTPAPLPAPVSLDDKRYQPPDDVWFTLKPRPRYPRYVVWEASGRDNYSTENRMAKSWFLEHLDTTAEYLRRLGGGRVVALPTFTYNRIRKNAAVLSYVYEASFDELPGHQVIRVTREIPASLPEVVALIDQSTQRRPLPAEIVRIESPTAPVYAIHVPEHLILTAIEGITSYENIAGAMRRLFSAEPATLDALAALPPGSRLMVRSRSELKMTKAGGAKPSNGRTFVFSKMADGEIYLTAWLNTNQEG